MSKAAVSNWKSMRILGEAGGSVLLLPNKNMPGPLRGVKPASGLPSVLASASTLSTPTLQYSACQDLHASPEITMWRKFSQRAEAYTATAAAWAQFVHLLSTSRACCVGLMS